MPEFDFSAWSPQQIADAWNSINARDRVIGSIVVAGAFVRFAIVPLVDAWRKGGRRD